LNEALLKLSTGHVPVRFVKSRKARRYILRVLREGVARVTIPRGGTVRAGWEFLHKHQCWVEKQIRVSPRAWQDGMTVFLRGEQIELRVAPEFDGSFAVSLGPFQWNFPRGADIRKEVERALRRIAEPELIARTFEMAKANGLEVRAVQVRNQRSRWGSCSGQKRISLNWRLIQAPLFVRDYIITHELMHLREMNHSKAFWNLVKNALHEYRQAEAWLGSHSKLLR